MCASLPADVLFLEEEEEEEEQEEEAAGLFSLLHMFGGYSALTISVHHTVITHNDDSDVKSDGDVRMR